MYYVDCSFKIILGLLLLLLFISTTSEGINIAAKKSVNERFVQLRVFWKKTAFPLSIRLAMDRRCNKQVIQLLNCPLVFCTEFGQKSSNYLAPHSGMVGLLTIDPTPSNGLPIRTPDCSMVFFLVFFH